MLSSLANPGMPPLMSPEAEAPGMFALGKMNFQNNMKDPAKSKIANAMLSQSLAQIGKGFLGGQPIQRSPSRFDMNGNPIG